MMTFSISASNHLFNACKLRSEESTRDNYAADLQRSLQGELSTPELARQFFQSTFPTIGMKDICRGIFSRLKQGDASNEPSVYRLGSSFGGGKTHTLIALAGAVRYPQLIMEGETPVPVEFAPGETVRLVTFTGENSDVERGALIPGSSDARAKSLIGQIAWQLGGEVAFNDFKTYDENLTSPGSEDIRRLLGERPCLILVDELVQWFDRIENSGLTARLPNIRTSFRSLLQAVTSRRVVSLCGVSYHYSRPGQRRLQKGNAARPRRPRRSGFSICPYLPPDHPIRPSRPACHPSAAALFPCR